MLMLNDGRFTSKVYSRVIKSLVISIQAVLLLACMIVIFRKQDGSDQTFDLDKHESVYLFSSAGDFFRAFVGKVDDAIELIVYNNSRRISLTLSGNQKESLIIIEIDDEGKKKQFIDFGIDGIIDFSNEREKP